MSDKGFDINKSALDLWKEKYCDNKESTKFVPALYPELKKECLLFLGLNPSFKEDYMKKKAKEKGNKDLFSFEKYMKSCEKKSIQQKIIECEKEARGEYPYFKRFEKIAKDVRLEWEHLDIFFRREKKQEPIKRDYLKSHEVGFKTTFAEKQFKIAFNAINVIKPKIVVVVNALASKIIKHNCKSKLNSHDFEKDGYHRISINKITIPIFFSGMLTGQRALDIGSYERLKWHIKQAANVLSKEW